MKYHVSSLSLPTIPNKAQTGYILSYSRFYGPRLWNILYFSSFALSLFSSFIKNDKTRYARKLPKNVTAMPLTKTNTTIIKAIIVNIPVFSLWPFSQIASNSHCLRLLRLCCSMVLMHNIVHAQLNEAWRNRIWKSPIGQTLSDQFHFSKRKTAVQADLSVCSLRHSALAKVAVIMW